MHVPNIKAIEKLNFIIFNIMKTFNYLTQTFIRALIL